MELVKCNCCGGSMSDRAVACPLCGDVLPRKIRFHEKLSWFVVWLFSIISLFSVVWASILATGISAPQQCAVIGGAIGFVIAPYCYARAVEKFDS